MLTIEKINFREKSVNNIDNKSFDDHRQNFIEALNFCKNERETLLVLKAALNIMYKKIKLDEANSLIQNTLQ